jgi:LmbE family N-acetylglucosaminyl deacetylase
VSIERSPVVVHVSPHPDDEALGAPGVLLRLRDAGWTVVNLAVSLGRSEQYERRRSELLASTRESGFELRIADPPVRISSNDDLGLAEGEVSAFLSDALAELGPDLVVGPSAFDAHHGHQCVGRSLMNACEATNFAEPVWLWNIWGVSEPANLLVEFDGAHLTAAGQILAHHVGEVERADLGRLLVTRANYHAAVGVERVLGFGSEVPPPRPRTAHLLTEVRLSSGQWTSATPRLVRRSAVLGSAGSWQGTAVRVR